LAHTYLKNKTYWNILLARCVLMYCVFYYCVFKTYPVWISTEILLPPPPYNHDCYALPHNFQAVTANDPSNTRKQLPCYFTLVFKLFTLYRVTRYYVCAWRLLASYETTLYLDRCWWTKDKTVNLSYILLLPQAQTSSEFRSIGTFFVFCRVLHSIWTQKGI